MGREKRHRRDDDDDDADDGSDDEKKARSSRKARHDGSRERGSNRHRDRRRDDDDGTNNGRDGDGKDRDKKPKKRLRSDDEVKDPSTSSRRRNDRKDDQDDHSADRRRSKKKGREGREREEDGRRRDAKERGSSGKEKKSRSTSSRSHRRDDHDDNNDGKNRDHRHRSRRDESERKHKKSSKKRHRDSEESDDSRVDKSKSRKSHQRGHDGHRHNKVLGIRKPDKSSIRSMGNPLGHAPEAKIDAKVDYYSFHQEFWVYLFREEGIAFNDLDADAAHEAFGRFAGRYNAGELEEPYYSRTIPTDVIEESKTTQHAWSFKTTETERKGLEALHDGIRRQTEYGQKVHDKQQQPHQSSVSGQTSNPNYGHNPNVDPSHARRKTPEERLVESRENKRLKETVRTVEEELTGGAKDLREKQLAKKRDHAARIHGASNDKEDGGAGVELTDSALYGDAEQSSFQSALARERRSKEKREEQRASRIGELQSKEEERRRNMLKSLGLENLSKGQKITIAPRKDG